MTHFVCRCGCNRFEIEQLPRGRGYCRLLLTCKGCGEIAQVFAEDIAGVLRFRVTGTVRIVTDETARTTAPDCPAAWEFREAT